MFSCCPSVPFLYKGYYIGLGALWKTGFGEGFTILYHQQHPETRLSKKNLDFKLFLDIIDVVCSWLKRTQDLALRKNLTLWVIYLFTFLLKVVSAPSICTWSKQQEVSLPHDLR